MNYELPIDFKLTSTNQSEHPHYNALADQFLYSPLLAAVTVSSPTAILTTMCSVASCIEKAFCRSLTLATCGKKRISTPSSFKCPPVLWMTRSVTICCEPNVATLLQRPQAMLSRRWRECRCEVKGGAHESESRASSSISAAAAFQL